MHVVALLSCMLASIFGAEASSRHPNAPHAAAPSAFEVRVEAEPVIAQQTTRRPPAQPVLRTQPPEPEVAWHWVQPLGSTAPGIWVSHPPVELAVDLLGVEAVQKCVAALGRPNASRRDLACAVEITPCQRLVLPTTGPLRLELDTACFRGESEAALWAVPDKAPEPRVEPSAPKRPTGT